MNQEIQTLREKCKSKQDVIDAFQKEMHEFEILGNLRDQFKIQDQMINDKNAEILEL